MTNKENKKYNYILVDSNNYFFRHMAKDIENFKKTKKISIFGLQSSLNSISSLINLFGYSDTKIYWLFDNNQSKIQFRKIIDPDYKHSREKEKLPREFYEYLDIFANIMLHYSDNFNVAYAKRYEADDLVLPVLQSIDLKNKKVLLVSADMDWGRSINENIEWYNYKEIYNENKFIEKFKFSPVGKKIQLFKALKGDRSDNIENAVDHLPSHCLEEILSKYETPQQVFDNLNTIKSLTETFKNKIRINRDQILKNYDLADFCEIDLPIDQVLNKSKFNKEFLVYMQKSLGVNLGIVDKKKEDDFFSQGKIISFK